MIKIQKHKDIIEWNYSSDNRLFRLITKPFWASVYFIDGLLIDTGSPSSTGEFEKLINSDELKGRIEKAIITHWHEDHTGGAAMISEKYGIKTYAASGGLDIIHSGFSIPYYRKPPWGRKTDPAPSVKELETDRITTPGSKYNFEIIETRGHAEGQICLYEKEHSFAFTADAVMPVYRMLFGPPANIDEDIKLIHESLLRLYNSFPEKKQVTLFMSGNGIKENGKKFIKEKIDEIEYYHEKVKKMKSEGIPPRKILKKLFGGDTAAAFISRGAFSRMNFIQSLYKWQ